MLSNANGKHHNIYIVTVLIIDWRKEGGVIRVYPDTHICIDQVQLAYKNWAKGWVGFRNLGEQAVDFAAKLDGFRRGVAAHIIVETTESVIINNLRPPDVLWY